MMKINLPKILKFSLRYLVIFSFILYALFRFTGVLKSDYYENKKYRQKGNTVWSKDWPKVNIKNCSSIVYLNKGINEKSPLALPRVGLVSFPGSGNTWVRYLIRQATGIWTGSIYHDASLLKGGFAAELDNCNHNGTIVVKAHHGENVNCPFDKIVFLVRDPFGALLAEFNWRQTHSHTGTPPVQLFGEEVWTKHVKARSEKWVKSVSGWLENFANDGVNNKDYSALPKFSQKILLVSYERLKRNVVPELERIVKFLGLKEFRRECLESETGSFKRNEKPFDGECVYDNMHRNILNEAIKKVEQVSADLGISNISSDFDQSYKQVMPQCYKWKLTGAG